MILKIKVIPKSKRSELVFSDEVRAYVRAAPDGGKANAELIKLLKKKFKRARIVRGFTSRNKVVEVE